MKRFIRYLYEYEEGRRLRNVGFVRVDQEETVTTVQVHGKGLHTGMNGQRLKVYLFFLCEKECMGIYAGQTEEVGTALNYELCYTPKETITTENYERIAGIILKDEDGHWYAALWDEDMTDVCKMKVWKKEEGTAHCEKNEDEEQKAIPQKTGENILDKNISDKNISDKDILDKDVKNNVFELSGQSDYGKEDGKEKNIQSEDLERNIHPEMKRKNDAEKRTIQKEDKEEKDRIEKNNDMEKRKHFHVRKIQRKDLVMLPRCEWRLANNSFLVHGYYNYHHLILTVADDRLKLGVPGVYYPQEAKAAESFGFPEFLSLTELGIELTEEEKNDQENFGYWCRNVRGSVDIMNI